MDDIFELYKCSFQVALVCKKWLNSKYVKTIRNIFINAKEGVEEYDSFTFYYLNKDIISGFEDEDYVYDNPLLEDFWANCIDKEKMELLFKDTRVKFLIFNSNDEDKFVFKNFRAAKIRSLRARSFKKK